MTKNLISKRDALKLIDQHFRHLQDLCSNKDMRDCWGDYLKQQREEMKRHRSGKIGGCIDGLTGPQEVKLFAVQDIFNVVNGYKVDAADFLSLRTGLFHAAGLVSRYGLKDVLDIKAVRHFLNSVDYAELNKDPRY